MFIECTGEHLNRLGPTGCRRLPDHYLATEAFPFDLWHVCNMHQRASEIKMVWGRRCSEELRFTTAHIAWSHISLRGKESSQQMHALINTALCHSRLPTPTHFQFLLYTGTLLWQPGKYCPCFLLLRNASTGHSVILWIIAVDCHDSWDYDPPKTCPRAEIKCWQSAQIHSSAVKTVRIVMRCPCSVQ